MRGVGIGRGGCRLRIVFIVVVILGWEDGWIFHFELDCVGWRYGRLSLWLILYLIESVKDCNDTAF